MRTYKIIAKNRADCTMNMGGHVVTFEREIVRPDPEDDTGYFIGVAWSDNPEVLDWAAARPRAFEVVGYPPEEQAEEQEPEETEEPEAEEPEEELPEPVASERAVKLAEKHGIDLRNVEGTGADGKITVPDVKACVEED